MEDEDEFKALTERVRELEEHMLFVEEYFNVSPHKPEVMFPKESIVVVSTNEEV